MVLELKRIRNQLERETFVNKFSSKKSDKTIKFILIFSDKTKENLSGQQFPSIYSHLCERVHSALINMSTLILLNKLIDQKTPENPSFSQELHNVPILDISRRVRKRKGLKIQQQQQQLQKQQKLRHLSRPAYLILHRSISDHHRYFIRGDLVIDIDLLRKERSAKPDSTLDVREFRPPLMVSYLRKEKFFQVEYGRAQFPIRDFSFVIKMLDSAGDQQIHRLADKLRQYYRMFELIDEKIAASRNQSIEDQAEIQMQHVMVDENSSCENTIAISLGNINPGFSKLKQSGIMQQQEEQYSDQTFPQINEIEDIRILCHGHGFTKPFSSPQSNQQNVTSSSPPAQSNIDKTQKGIEQLLEEEQSVVVNPTSSLESNHLPENQDCNSKSLPIPSTQNPISSHSHLIENLWDNHNLQQSPFSIPNKPSQPNFSPQPISSLSQNTCSLAATSQGAWSFEQSKEKAYGILRQTFEKKKFINYSIYRGSTEQFELVQRGMCGEVIKIVFGDLEEHEIERLLLESGRVTLEDSLMDAIDNKIALHESFLKGLDMEAEHVSIPKYVSSTTVNSIQFEIELVMEKYRLSNYKNQLNDFLIIIFIKDGQYARVANQVLIQQAQAATKPQELNKDFLLGIPYQAQSEYLIERFYGKNQVNKISKYLIEKDKQTNEIPKQAVVAAASAVAGFRLI